MKLLVTALTNRDLARLDRLLCSLTKQAPHDWDLEIQVVCNTLDLDYPKEARELATAYGVTFVQTPSNGKPGKGKNSCLTQFRHSKADYLLLMDGDDFLYPSALRALYYTVFHNRPDVLGFQTNDILDTAQLEGCKGVPIPAAPGVHLYSWFDAQFNLYQERFFHRVDRTKKLGEHTTPDRILLISKKAVPYLYCSEELPVFEDYLLSMTALKGHAQGRFVYMQTCTSGIYIYDKTQESSTCKDYLKVNNGDWSRHDELFRKEMEDIEPHLPLIHQRDLPFLFISPSLAPTNPNYKLEFFNNHYLNDPTAVFPPPSPKE